MAIMMTNDIEWKMVKLGDVTQVFSGGTPSTDHLEYWNGNIPWMNSGELNLKIVNAVEGRITELGLKSSSTHWIPKECVLIGLAGQGKTRGTAAFNTIPLCTNQSIAAIYPNESFFDSKYLYFYFDTQYEKLRELSSGGGGRGGLNKNHLLQYMVPIPYKNGAPDLETQKQIAQKLSDMESLIAAKEKLLAKKRNLKTAAMQKLIKNEEGENWKKVKLGELIDSANYGVGAEAVDYDGENKYLRITDIDDRTHEFIPNPLVSPSYFSERYLVKADDLLIARTGASVGKTYLYNEKDGKLIYAGFLMKLHIKKAISKFVFYQTLTENYNKFILSESARTGQPGVNLQQIKKFEINIPFNSDASPDLNEQRRIASILSDMDSEIAAIEKEITKLQNLKTAMMQKMFCFGDSDSSSE